MWGKDDSTYAYLTANVRAIIGNLLEIQDYHALLGCSKAIHVVDVLVQTGYRRHLEPRRSRLDLYSIRQTILDSFITILWRAISSSPKPAGPLLLSYRQLLETWSLINALRASFFQPNFAAEAQIIPCGLFDRSFYEMSSHDLVRTLELISGKEGFREGAKQVKLAVETNRLGPLFAMLRHPLRRPQEADAPP